MNFNFFLLERLFKRLELPESALKQIRIASSLCDVEGRGFPRELFQLTAPMIARGVLNFAVLQMKRDWVYPYWTHRQLDPHSSSHIPRAQNPLLMNLTHRNWTMLGTPTGFHEAIVDPRGAVTPLPREWSIDVWLSTGKKLFFPSLAEEVEQTLDTDTPRITTVFRWQDLRLVIESFVHKVRRGTDVLFHRARVVNTSPSPRRGSLYIAIRPFNPEGVAPVESIEFRSPRLAYVNDAVGLVFAQEPDWVLCAGAAEGDVAGLLPRGEDSTSPDRDADKRGRRARISCPQGLAQAVAAFAFQLAPQADRVVDCSAALATEKELRRRPVKATWKVSYEHRRQEQHQEWTREIESGAGFRFPDPHLQALFAACRLSLLQLHDGDFLSPGPYLYHRFWFRDAAAMLRALDVLGYPGRVRQVIDAFPRRLARDGFFRGPEGEWDSNGAVLWTVYQHYLMTRSPAWLKQWYPALRRGAAWVQRMRGKNQDPNSAGKGLMPRSLSAEHLGTVDQYYWDSLWSLAGVKAMREIALELRDLLRADRFQEEAEDFETDILESFARLTERLGRPLMPAGPDRTFDEGAVGSLCSIYPLRLFGPEVPYPRETARALDEKFVDEKGFFHPFIHSGYNPYLTLQLAHSFLYLGNPAAAWRLAAAVFRQATPPYSLPEAIHPRTGGGAMGDGHHGAAAAEIILFLRDCLLLEEKNSLQLLPGIGPELFQHKRPFHVQNAPTQFGNFSFAVEFEPQERGTIRFSTAFFPQRAPQSIDVHLPLAARRVFPVSPLHLLGKESHATGTILKLSPAAAAVAFALSG